MSAKYSIGIDLGTTNCALAYTALEGDGNPVELLPIPRLTAPATVESRLLLPSFLYLAGDSGVAPGAYDLPWKCGQNFAIGDLASTQAAEQPTRTIAAAKSWLSHSRVDRRQPILPWNSPEAEIKVSPLEASKRYLEHLKAAWNATFPKSPLEKQLVTLTAPASFDASARELTREAAVAAGFPEDFTLLEEPQAAVYAWLADMGESWRRQLKLGDSLLVCDVGGGTTDLTLIVVGQDQGELILERRAVGDHLLVGGDNMDLALAHHAASLFAEKGTTLDPWQAVSLWHACRTAKEALLSEKASARHKVSVLGRGSKLIAKTISVELERDAARSLLLDGFFPLCGPDEKPARPKASGFRELGLPFEADTAITRHLAKFLASHGDSPNSRARPTRVLFNGGVFKAVVLRDRLFSALTGWNPDAPIRGLEGNSDLDHAVARGAAYYGAAKRGKGMRIRGGTARSYYVGIETSGLAIPGAARPLRAVCVAPFGMEEGSETDVPGEEVGVITGEPAHFRFFSSATRRGDPPGAVLRNWTAEELSETDSLEATLPAVGEDAEGHIPVRFLSRVTELGMFELWCVALNSDHRWKLEFSVREE